MDDLYKFYISKDKELVKGFLVKHLSDMAIDDCFVGKETAWVSKAKNYIEDAFAKLDEIFSSKEEENKLNSSR